MQNSINGSIRVSTITTSGTFTFHERMQLIDIILVSGGSGGGSGRQGVSGQAGGGSGGAGSCVYSAKGIPREYFSGSSIIITIGVGGIGGAPQTTPDTDGNPGALGGRTWAGDFVTQQATDQASGGGINTVNAGRTAQFSALPYLQQQLSGADGRAGRGRITDGEPSAAARWMMATGGGGGAGADIGIAYVGGFGGMIEATDGLVVKTPGGFGGNEFGDINGGDGQAQLPSGPYSAGMMYWGGGGGGGGGQSSGLVAGNGGNGGGYGSGGGGGGGSLNGTPSGAGGNGAPGLVIITEYLF